MKFHIDDEALTINLEGSERFWALKKSIVIPLSSIDSIQWSREYAFRSPGTVLRIGGTGLPTVLYAGRFYDFDAKRKLFMYVVNPQGWSLKGRFDAENVLEVVTKDFPYARIIVTAQPDIGPQIVDYWQTNK